MLNRDENRFLMTFEKENSLCSFCNNLLMSSDKDWDKGMLMLRVLQNNENNEEKKS